MARASPPLDVTAWPSHAYWRDSDARIKQYWYVSFCLMMSAVQDRLTGLTLRESGNLNWATTAFYYSAVHAGRLLCFVCTGDYPTGHAQLAQLLAPGQERPEARARRQFHFDWLERFLRYVRARVPGAPAERPEPPRADREAIISAIDATLPQVRETFDRFAPLLAKFKNLRNDCNYEALLVAHEVDHFRVTEDFSTLVRCADQASRVAVELATGAYMAFVQNDPCFEQLRPRFHAAHADYLDHRFTRSLEQKFRGEPGRAELNRVRRLLKWSDAPCPNDIEQFLKPIMFDTFGEKQGLMQRWRDDIQSLQQVLPPPR